MLQKRLICHSCARLTLCRTDFIDVGEDRLWSYSCSCGHNETIVTRKPGRKQKPKSPPKPSKPPKPKINPKSKSQIEKESKERRKDRTPQFVSDIYAIGFKADGSPTVLGVFIDHEEAVRLNPDIPIIPFCDFVRGEFPYLLLRRHRIKRFRDRLLAGETLELIDGLSYGARYGRRAGVVARCQIVPKDE